MKLKYIGESFGADSLTNGKIYDATVEDNDYYRVIDKIIYILKLILHHLTEVQ